MSVSTIVRDAILAQCLEVSPTTTFTVEGARHTPTATDVYCRLKVLQRESTLTSIGTNYRTMYQGLVQLDIIGPRGTGLEALEAIAAALLTISRHPPTDTGRLIVNTVWQEAVFEEPAKLRVPVLVRWDYHADSN